ncbi:MAG: sodium:solute symporter family protein [Amoebophilaceae bacterium]|nr:sodium:solute symporter family protein [Amoebophilaceae bacterium]
MNLILGIYYSKGIKTFEEYAIGNRKMSTFVLTLSLIATTYGGSTLNSRLDACYRNGIYAFMLDLASPLSFYLAARFIIIRMQEFLGDVSVAESMGKLYGNTVRLVTAILGTLLTIALIVPQFKVGARMVTLLLPNLELFNSISPTIWVVLLGCLVIGYSTIGGARAVALTDVFQFFTFGLCCPVIIFTLLYQTNNPDAWKTTLTTPPFNLKAILTPNEAVNCLTTYLIWAVFPFDPGRIHRFYMASSIRKAQKVFHNSTIIRIILPLFFLGVAFALHVGKHTIEPNKNALDYIVGLTYAPGIKGILVAAIIALLMSTADSNLHAASVLVANDILPIWTKSTQAKPTLKTVRIVSVVVGIISLMLAIHTTQFIPLMYSAVLFYVPAVTVPLIMASLGFRPCARAVVWHMAINIAITMGMVYYKGPQVSQQDIFQSILVSIGVLFMMHHFLPKLPHTGWVGIRDSTYLDYETQATKLWWASLWPNLKTLFTSNYWSRQFPKEKGIFLKFGSYLVVHAFIALLHMNKSYFIPYIYWYMAIMAMGTYFLAYPGLHGYQAGGSR